MSNIVHTRIVLGALLFFSLAGCSLTSSPSPSSLSATPTRPAYTIDTSPVAKGIIVPQKTFHLSFNVSGRVQDVYIEAGDVVSAGDALVKLETVSFEADVAHAEGSLLAAQAEFEYRKTQPDPAELLTVAAAKVSMAEADLVKARYLLTQTTLTAPSDGTIVDVQTAPGETVALGRVIVTMADFQTFQVETTDLNEFYLPQIYPGQQIVAYIEALDIEVAGSVITIVPQAVPLGEDGVYKVIIRFNAQPPNLHWGMSADVRFVTEGSK